MHDNSLTSGNRRWAKGLWALGRSRVVLGHRAEAKPSSQQERAHLANRWIVECMWTEHFSSSGIGKARWVKLSQGQNRIRENRPSGIVGGPGETWPWRNWEPTP
jgi:hypothetical protein